MKYLAISFALLIVLFSANVIPASAAIENYYGNTQIFPWSLMQNVGTTTCTPTHTITRVNGCTPGTSTNVGMDLHYNFPEPTLITSISISITWNKTRGGTLVDTQYIRFNGSNVATYNITPTGTGSTVISWSGSQTVSNLLIALEVRNNNSGDGSYMRLNSMTIETSSIIPTLTRPIHPAGLAYPGYANEGEAYINTTIFNEIPVFAAEPSTVTAVTTTDYITCIDDLDPGLAGFNCMLSVPEDVTGGAAENYNVPVDVFSSSLTTIQLVGESGLTYQYLVANPKVVVGQEIDDTCYMATTFPVTEIPQIFGTDNVNSAVSVAVSEDGNRVNPVDPDEYFTVDPPAAAAPCDSPPAYEQCLGNPIANNAAEWSGQNNVTWQSDRVIISSGGYIEKVVTLPAGTPYAYVYAKGVGGDATATVLLSQVTDPGNFSTSSVIYPSYFLERSYTITLATEELVLLRVTNSGDNALELKSACLTVDEAGSGTPGAPENPPNEDEEDSSCNLSDAGFNSSGTWTATGAQYFNGEWRLDSGDSISQNVSLAAGNWYITVKHRASYLANVTLDIQDASDNALLEINLGAGWVTLDTVTESDYASYQNSVTSTAMYNLASAYTGSFQIRVTITGMSGAQIALLSACLGTSQYDDTGTTFFPTKCGSAINTPSGESNAVWTSWLWANLDQFYNCELMTLLNSMYKLGLEQYKTLGWTIRYWQTSYKLGLLWLEDSVFPWLAGYFSNMTTGATTTIIAEEQCNNLFCFLGGIGELLLTPIQSLVDGLVDTVDRLLAILEDGFGFLFGALTGFVETGYSIIDYLLAVMNDARNLIASILTLWNDTEPASLPFVPTCSTNPQSSGMCVAFWVMEHTIFSGTGAAFIPLIISFGSLLGLLWAARKLRNAINMAGGLL